MSEKNPPDSNFMTKLATFIVDKKTLFFLLYIFAVIFCAFSSGWVNVENDVTTYLPEDTETRQGIVAMNDNFTTFATAQIMVSNVTYETADELSQQIADVEGGSMVTFDDTPTTTPMPRRCSISASTALSPTRSASRRYRMWKR